MKRIHYAPLLIFTLFVRACSPGSSRQGNQIVFQKLPELCEVFQFETEATVFEMVSSAGVFPACEISVNGVVYSIALGDERRVVSISTKDPGFETENGLSVNSTLEDISKFTKSELIREPGFGYILELPSGWVAGFFMGQTGTESPPGLGTKVGWFFKRVRCSHLGEIWIGDDLLIRGDHVELIETPGGKTISATGNALVVRHLGDPDELRIATAEGSIFYDVETKDIRCADLFTAEKNDKRLFEGGFGEALVQPPTVTFHADGATEVT
ncbi:MAG: hypothetical protein H7A52_02360 [Akkermansiaceae bacterium]|nr:hypothetical protein [Akkermansiaceae bacterium]